MGVRVENKSGDELIKTISENVGRMLRRKMDAVRCIYKEAEDISEQWDANFTTDFTYYSAKYSISCDENPECKEPTIPENMMELNANESYL